MALNKWPDYAQKGKKTPRKRPKNGSKNTPVQKKRTDGKNLL